jgi:hypothetical protein
MKGIQILVAEQVRHLCDIDIRPVEILVEWPDVHSGLSRIVEQRG